MRVDDIELGDDLIVEVDTTYIEPKKRKGGRPRKKPAVVKPDLPPVVMGGEEPVVIAPVAASPPVGTSLAATREVRRMFDFRGSKLSTLQQVYILAFATRGTRAEACKVAEVTYAMVDKWMEDAEFAERLSDAVAIVGDRLEAELFRRAMDGSDKLLLRAMEANRPEKYAPKQTINASVTHSWAELARQASEVLSAPALSTSTYEEVEEGDDDGSE